MKPLSILLADDSRSVGAYIADFLRSNGHTVTLVHNGEEAVESFRNDRPELVLMDIHMPGIGGLEAIKQIRSVPTSRWIPIIIITGSTDEADTLSGFLAGADDFILKPVNPLLLEVRINAMMRIAAIQRASTALIDNAIEGIVRIDGRGRISLFNRAAEQIFGYRADEVHGKNVSMLMPSPDREQHDGYLTNYLTTGERKIIGIGRQVVGLHRDGRTFPMYLGVTEADTPDGKFFIGLVRDLTVEEELRRQLQHQATHDALTGLPNRALCWNHLDERFALRSSEHGPAECSVFYCDLDGFKQVNDQFGHTTGDTVLCCAVERMRGAIFVRDFIARIGGDEFVVVVDGWLSDTQAKEVAQRIIEAFAAPIETNQGTHPLGISIGIAHARDHRTLNSLISAADGAMYAAKRNGRNNAVLAG